MRRKEALKRANITHVVSALCLPLDRDLFEAYKHLVLEADDVEDENILQYFATSNPFIQDGLDGGGGVLVHWYVSETVAGFLPPPPCLHHTANPPHQSDV